MTYGRLQDVARNPTFAMALAALTAPIRIASFTIDADEGVAEERTTSIEKVFRDLVADARARRVARVRRWLRMPFEKVFTVRPVGGIERLTFDKIKWLLADPTVTKVLLDEKTGCLRRHPPSAGGPDRGEVVRLHDQPEGRRPRYGDPFAAIAEEVGGLQRAEFDRSGRYRRRSAASFR